MATRVRFRIREDCCRGSPSADTSRSCGPISRSVPKGLSKLGVARSRRHWRLGGQTETHRTLPPAGCISKGAGRCQYIASVIRLIVFHRRTALVDSNMARAIARCFGPGKKADIRYYPWTQGIAGRLVANRKALEINWAILDLAATTCRPRLPGCQPCPLSSSCI